MLHLQEVLMPAHQRATFANFQDKRDSFTVSVVTMGLYITRLSQQPGFNSQPRLRTPQVTLLNTCKDKNYLGYIKARFQF